MRTPMLVLAAGLSVAFAPAPPRPADPNKAAWKQLAGTWEMVSCKAGGIPVAGPVRDVRVQFARGRMLYGRAGKVYAEYAITLDARKRPKVMDARLVKPVAGTVFRGVYALKGDTLTICSAQGNEEEKRPKDLSGAQPGQTLEVFKRRKR
jgi:uncharacterized protein (TIGR03067 family)